MTGWWRRNGLALGAVAVLLPATALTIGLHEWQDYFSGRPSSPVTVPAGEEIVYGGATWGPVRSGFANDTSGFDIPEGAALYIVAVPVVPDPEADAPARCDAPVLTEVSTGRQWQDASFLLDLRTRAEEPVRCVSDAAEPYTIFVPYVIPSDAAGPFSVDISSADTLPEFLRFAPEG